MFCACLNLHQEGKLVCYHHAELKIEKADAMGRLICRDGEKSGCHNRVKSERYLGHLVVSVLDGEPQRFVGQYRAGRVAQSGALGSFVRVREADLRLVLDEQSDEVQVAPLGAQVHGRVADLVHRIRIRACKVTTKG